MWLEKKYVNLVSARLERFAWKSPNLANFKCPLCGDSKNNPKKTRAYIYEKGNKVMFHCHNCGVTHTFSNFLKQIDYRLYSEFKVELMKDDKKTKDDNRDHIWKTNTAIHFNKRLSDDIKALKGLKKISQLDPSHPAKQYVVSRQIPTPWHSILRWAPNFQEWTNELLPGKFGADALKHDEGRIVIPFFTKDQKFHAYQGRCLSANAVRYIMIIIEPEIPVIFGQDRIDEKHPIWAFEGPIDAMFIPNAVAFGGGHFSSLTNVAKRDKFIVVVDNEPHSIETKKKVDHIINNGFRVVIWPSNIVEKDINEMILAGYSADYLQEIMMKNTYEGIKAKAMLAQWSKV